MSSFGSDLPAVPTVLFQAFPLETYLRNLSNHLSERLATLNNTLATLQDDAKTSCTSMKHMRSFMRQQALSQLEERMVEAGLTMPTGNALESLLPAFLRDSSSPCADGDLPLSIEMIGGSDYESDVDGRTMRSFVDSLSRTRIYTQHEGDAEEKHAREEASEARARLERMCKDLERTQQQHMSELERLTAWLRPAPTVADVESSLSAEDLSRRARMQEELLEIMRTAPLFVEFRRHLLRDVSDRIADSRESQSMSFGSAMVALKEEVRRDVLSPKAKKHTGGAGGSNSATGSVGEAEQRLRDIDRRYITREEALAALRDKADAAAVAAKADDDRLRDLEGRCERRLEDLEERMALYEAERREFRHILRAVVDTYQRPMQQQQEATATRGNAPQAEILTPRHRALIAVDDAADPRRKRRGDGVSARHATTNAAFHEMLNSSGAGGAGGAGSARQAGGDMRRKGRTAEGVSLSVPPATGMPDLPLQAQQPATGKGRFAAGMTANQEAYANYVTNELNRHAIEQLPPLPYERRNQ